MAQDETLSLLRMDGEGWKIELFVDKHISSYICCKECLEKLINQNDGKCPSNQHLLPIITQSRVIRRQILNSKAVCPYPKRYGHCIGEGKESILVEHDEDDIMDHCDFNGSLNELSHHLSTTCSYHKIHKLQQSENGVIDTEMSDLNEPQTRSKNTLKAENAALNHNLKQVQNQNEKLQKEIFSQEIKIQNYITQIHAQNMKIEQLNRFEKLFHDALTQKAGLQQEIKGLQSKIRIINNEYQTLQQRNQNLRKMIAGQGRMIERYVQQLDEMHNNEELMDDIYIIDSELYSKYNQLESEFYKLQQENKEFRGGNATLIFINDNQAKQIRELRDANDNLTAINHDLYQQLDDMNNNRKYDFINVLPFHWISMVLIVVLMVAVAKR